MESESESECKSESCIESESQSKSESCIESKSESICQSCFDSSAESDEFLCDSCWHNQRGNMASQRNIKIT